jgi:hypothetical protein
LPGQALKRKLNERNFLQLTNITTVRGHERAL